MSLSSVTACEHLAPPSAHRDQELLPPPEADVSIYFKTFHSALLRGSVSILALASPDQIPFVVIQV